MLRNLGSTLALVFGGLSILSGLSPAVPGSGDRIIMGIMTLLGALAYRSAKVRRDQGHGTVRLVFECVAMAIVLFLWLDRNDLKQMIATNPFPAVIVPLWIVIAYAVMFVKALRPNMSDTDVADIFK